MKTWLIPGLVLLAASTGVNALALVRLSRTDERPRLAARPVATPCLHEERVIREVLRPEVVPPVQLSAAAAVPPAAIADDGLSALLHDQDAIARLFARLDQLRAVRARLPREKVEEAALRLTAETLDLDARRFAPAARLALEDLRRAAKAHEEELGRIAAAGGSVPVALSESYEDHRRRAREGMAACLGESPLHQIFRERLDEWITGVLAE